MTKHPLVFRAMHAGEGACGYRAELLGPAMYEWTQGEIACSFSACIWQGRDAGCWQQMDSSEQGSYRGSAGYVYQPQGGVHSAHSRC